MYREIENNQNLAVVLNKNARSVSRGMRRRIAQLHPSRDLFVSETPEHGREIAQHLVDQGYRTVATGGGDGTFVQCITDIFQYLESQGSVENAPRFFVLRLGTGNAVATTIGASAPTRRGLIRDLARARATGPSQTMPVLAVDGKISPFAGVGLDATILHHYYAHRDFLKDTVLKPLATGPAGYALSVTGRTVPSYLLSRFPELVIRNTGGPAYRVRAKGLFLERVEPGEIIYRGPASIASASTIPYTGMNMRLFPYARLRRDRFSFRVSFASTYEIIANLPAIWRGSYESPSILDFLADEITVESSKPVPLQIGGDLAGLRENVRIRLAEKPIEIAG